MKLSALKLKENNPRKIGADEIERLKKSITEFPKMLELRPIIYDPSNFEVLAGNQRLKALKALGYKEIPENWVKSAENLTDDEKRRLVVVDNKAFGEWDFDILDTEFGDDLEDWGVDFGELDFKDTSNIGSNSEYADTPNDNDRDFSAKNKEVDVDSFDEKIELKLYFTIDEFSFIKGKIGNNNKENTLLNLLGYEFYLWRRLDNGL